MDTIWARGMAGEVTETSRVRKNVDIDDIISRMHSYRTDLGWFVDREADARETLEWGFERPIRGGKITVLYGPRAVVRALSSEL